MRMIRHGASALIAALMLTASVQASAQTTTVAAFAPHELESLAAPIALYPDALIANVLMASTYPLDVIAAVRWLNQPGNASLGGDDLLRALDAVDWDPSVKALIATPQVLRMMESRIDWVVRLGDAFVVDQNTVMDAVQRLRRQARANGELKSDVTRRVTVDSDGTILIEPASAQTVAVDVYQPATVYGAWAYPDAPPIYIEPPPEYVAVPIITYPVIVPLWGWSSWDWRRHHITLDVPRWRNLDRNRSHIVIDNRWEHDPNHRRHDGGTATPGILPPAIPGVQPPPRPVTLPPGLTPGDPRRGGGFGHRDDHDRDGAPDRPRRGGPGSPNLTNAAPAVTPSAPVTTPAPVATPTPNFDPGRFRHGGDHDRDNGTTVRPNMAGTPPSAPIVTAPPHAPDPPRVYLPPPSVTPGPTPAPAFRSGQQQPSPPPAPNLVAPPRPAPPVANEPKVVCSPGARCAPF